MKRSSVTSITHVSLSVDQRRTPFPRNQGVPTVLECVGSTDSSDVVGGDRRDVGSVAVHVLVFAFDLDIATNA